MRGHQERTGPLFSYVSTKDRIPKAHPLWQVRLLADQALDRLTPRSAGCTPRVAGPQYLLSNCF
jgi:hypothetical protein